jgi:type I restriction enzyme S subunit
VSELTLGEIAQIVDCEHKTAPATLDEPFGYSGGTRALNGHGINLSECKPVSEETYNAWSRRAELAQGDIVFAREAPVGGLGLVDGTVPLCLGQRTVLVRSNPSLVDSRYLYYLLRSEECQRQMIAMSTGSTVLHINVADVRNFKLNELPTLEIQCAIGEILSEIEEKIKVNQRIASTLEQIAQTIFKSWFVDFDPVHAKARGEQPVGMSAETAALFPDSFEDSELGPIPTGWKCLTLGDMVQPKKGKTITKAKTREGHVPVVAGGLGPAYFHDTSNVNPPVVTISASGTAGFVRLYTQPIWASDCTYISREQSDVVLFWLQFLKFNQARIYDMQQGGAQPHVYASDLMRLDICVPEEVSLLDGFEALIQPMFELIAVNERESETLAKLRDSLLPRLISGELEIPVELLEK